MSSAIPYASSSAGASLGSSDPITAAIGLLRPRTVADPGFRAAGVWAVSFEAFGYVRLGGVERGDCWLVLDGLAPVHLRQGDIYLLVNPPSYRLASDLTAEPLTSKALWQSAVDGVVRVGPEAEEDLYLCGGSFWFDDSNASILLDVLPPLVHIQATDPRNKLFANVSELLVTEAENGGVGSSLVLDYLVQILFVHALRAYAEQTDRPAGWLGAINDDNIGAALRAMHADVAHRWTLNELAGIAHLSRSAFAAAFKKQVGTAPLDYLIQWRMNLARDALRRNTRSISELASATGYESESAFSTAFRRVTGASPKQFRDQAAHVNASGR
jgi:AraC-like DNA-binding protein